jgi:hypothetical protein
MGAQSGAGNGLGAQNDMRSRLLYRHVHPYAPVCPDVQALASPLRKRERMDLILLQLEEFSVQRILEVPLDDYWMNKTKLFEEIMD